MVVHRRAGLSPSHLSYRQPIPNRCRMALELEGAAARWKDNPHPGSKKLIDPQHIAKFRPNDRMSLAARRPHGCAMPETIADILFMQSACLCAPKIRFCNIGGEGHRGRAVM